MFLLRFVIPEGETELTVSGKNLVLARMHEHHRN